MSSNKNTDVQLNPTNSATSISIDPNSQVTFFTICNSVYFPGLVGLINSLRLLGHYNPITVLDCGLNQRQKAILRPHCTLFELPSDIAKNPQQYKSFPYLLQPQGTIVIIDSDIIVAKSLDAILTSAKQGKVCVFPDPEFERWFGEWEKIFDLPIKPRRQTYVNSGFVAFSTSSHPKLLERWWHACEKTFSHPTYQEGAPNESPVAQSDQDAFNALLMTQYPKEVLLLQSPEEEVFGDFDSVRLINKKILSCQYRSHRPIFLHACLRPKPWESSAWHKITPGNVYTRLLRRLTAEPDVAVKVPPELLPVWLRPEWLGYLSFNGIMVLNQITLYMNRVQKKAKSMLNI